MIRASLACVFALAGAVRSQSLVEPPVYDRLFLVQPSTQRLTPLPVERVHQGGARLRPLAWIEGPRSPLRIPEGVDLFFVIAYRSGPAPGWAARLYLMEGGTGRRSVTLGVWAARHGAALTAGVVPLRLERQGRFSRRLILPPSLPPGEYAVSNPAGTLAFTFGIDPRPAAAPRTR